MNEQDPYELAAEAAKVLVEATGVEKHDVVLVLGSGWAAAADGLGDVVADVGLDDLPGFPAPKVLGHRNLARSVSVGDKVSLLFPNPKVSLTGIYPKMKVFSIS